MSPAMHAVKLVMMRICLSSVQAPTGRRLSNLVSRILLQVLVRVDRRRRQRKQRSEITVRYVIEPRLLGIDTEADQVRTPMPFDRELPAKLVEEPPVLDVR